MESATKPVLLFLVDGISKDCGVGLVRRLRVRRPDLKAMLLVTSEEAYGKNPATREVFDGIVAGGSVGRGGISSCIEALTKGERYLDSLLKEVQGQGSAWNDLNQREREILPLLATGKKQGDRS